MTPTVETIILAAVPPTIAAAGALLLGFLNRKQSGQKRNIGISMQ